jgi:hypothetical protein
MRRKLYDLNGTQIGGGSLGVKARLGASGRARFGHRREPRW